MENYEDLIGDIAKGGSARERALATIYRDRSIRTIVFSIIRKLRGNIQDAEDMYQESLIIMDRNIREGKYNHEGHLTAYLGGIARLCWMNQLRKNNRVDLYEQPNHDEASTAVPSPDHWLMDKERNELLESLLQKLDERCFQILRFWQLKTSMQEIADHLDLSSEMMARKLKYQCTKKLAALIHQHPEIERILKDSI